MSGTLERLAELAAIEPGYHDIAGVWHQATQETKRRLLAAMRIDEADAEAAVAALAALPPAPGEVGRCVVPADFGIDRAWGVTCQVYALRSDRNGGVGDLEDVARLAERLAAEGADFLGLSPLHALFPEAPERCSPYAPSSRRWLNELLIAVDAACDDLGLPAIEVLPRDAGALIDWPAVAAAKSAAYRRLWQGFRERHLGPRSGLARDFAAWRDAKGAALEGFCRFHALAEAAAVEAGRPVRPTDWPLQWRSPEDPAVAHFAAQHADAIARRAFLQWLAERQLAAAQRRACAAGMRLGLYCDLAVGVVADGAEAWAQPTVMVADASVGAPPDPLGPLGQNWNVVAFSPVALRAQEAAPLQATLRAAMQHAGAVRIDHVLGLLRLFLIPPGGTAADGAYVRYPFELLLKAVVEESRATRSLVVGEDLGTVPDGFRPRLQAAGLLLYRVLWFERDWPDRRFLPPERYPSLALATLSTHDLPTIRGFYAGNDIAWRERLGHFAGPEQARAERDTRSRDIGLLAEQLQGQGLGFAPTDEAGRAVALHRFLGRTRASLAAVQLDDLADALEQPNIPGTVTEHPNWRRRLPGVTDEIMASSLAQRIFAAMREERPR